MTPEAWKQIGNIVERALSLEGNARNQYLDRIYGESPALREEIEAMIKVYEEDQNFLETPAIEGISFDADSLPAQQIGPYRVIRSIGKGGMGEVYLVQREDGPISQPVALKLIRASGQDTDFMLIRFQVEQQILSELTHPNIARLLDAGSTSDGRPYFVMEYVDGLPITEYCDLHRLPVDARLNLFEQACKAVQFAHQNFIVHRDLKPSNLLVTREGEVKLLDFGIAKALDPWEAGIEAFETRTGFRVLTPTYASPEQVKGQAITTASDVYSLGILLYELLTGRRPYQLADKLEAEVVRVITEEPPTRPSDVITQRIDTRTEEGETQTLTPEHVSASRQVSVDRLQRKLKGELDNIVLMALRKEANRRYSSAAELGEDVRRHLEGLPVEAQPDSLGYRAGKFIRRHRWGVAFTFVFMSVFIFFSAVTFFQSLRIRAQSERIEEEIYVAQRAAEWAENEADKSEEIVDLLVGLFEVANPVNLPGGDTLSVGELLRRGESDVLTGLGDRPEVQARMRHVIGEMYFAQGNRKKAVQLLEAGLVQQREATGEDNLYAAEILRDLALMHHALGRRDTALVMLDTAITRFRQPGDRAANELATTLLTLAPMLSAGEHEKQAAMLEEANTLIENLERPDAMQRASAANQLGVFYYNQGAYSQALAPFAKTLTYLEQAVGKSHPYYLITAGNLAGIYQQVDRLDEAETLHREVLTERRKLTANDHVNIGVAWTLVQLGNIALQRGKWDEAKAYQEEAYALFSSAHNPDHPDIATYALPYADALIWQKKFEKAGSLIQEALNAQKTHFGAQSAEYAWALYKKASLQLTRENLDGTLESLTQAIDIWLGIYPDGRNASLADAWLLRGVVYLKQDLPTQAYEELERVLAYRTTDEAASKNLLAQAQLWTGVALSRLGRHEEAAALFEAGQDALKRPALFTEQNRREVEAAWQVTREHTAERP